MDWDAPYNQGLPKAVELITNDDLPLDGDEISHWLMDEYDCWVIGFWYKEDL
jgi:hypothetical protein